MVEEKSPRLAVLADCHPLWLDATAEVVEHGGFEVARRAYPGAEALRVLDQLRPDLFVTELAFEVEGLVTEKYIGEAHAISPPTKIIVLSASGDFSSVNDALSAGANAYVLKTARPEDLSAAIRLTFEHSVFFAANFPGVELARRHHPAHRHDPKLNELTRRELEILKLVSDGLTNTQLARRLWVSEPTVKFHLSNIYRKLGVANRTEASRWAQLNGLLRTELESIEPAAVGF